MAKGILILIVFLTVQNSYCEGPVYNVLDFGAKNDGRSISTGAIQKAIDRCSDNGGGIVEFPPSKYVSGTIFLKSYVTILLSPGAVLEGSRNLDDYPVTKPAIRSYTDNYTVRSLIYGEGLKSVSIKGEGMINGNGSYFTVSKEAVKKSLSDSYKARPYIIRIINCEKVTVENITIINSPMWVQHYLLCRDLLIHGITVNSRVNGNNDGIDIDACENVRISDCNISSGDDAIVLKSTLDQPCTNITISNCVISSDCNGFKLGTESSGDFRNITFSNCVIYNTRLAAIALETVDGGTMKNVIVSGVNIDSAGCPVFIRLGNRARPFTEGSGKPGIGKLSDIMITGIQATRAGIVGCSVTGLPGSPVEGILLRDIRIETSGGGSSELFTREIDELPDKYPEFSMFGKLPAYGFYIRHAIGITMENVELKSRITDGRPPVVLEDVHGARISGINASFSGDYDSPLIIRESTDIKTVDLSKIR
jgi:hypothetical protein